MANATGVPPERLDSWKAIAEYLGRDVATVRRWEKTQALPVRRVPGGPGRSVFAFRSEIDAWLLASGDLPEGPASAPLVSPATPLVGPPRRTRLWAAAGAALLVLLVLLWRTGRPSDAAGALRVEVTPAGVIARGPEGEEQWRLPFDVAWRTVPLEPRPGAAAAPIGGAHTGFVVATSYAESQTSETARSGEILWVETDGTVRHRYAPDHRVTFGSREYPSPWAITDYRLHPSAGPLRVAISAHHFQWWPGLLMLLDERWQQPRTFVNAGWIERVLWLSDDRLLISGFSNARDGGMVALLDAGAVAGQSPPTGDPDYACGTCGPSTALRYFVLPRSEVNRVSGAPFNRASIHVTGDRIIARTVEFPSDTGHAPEALYEFSDSLELVRASYGDRYWERHRLLERAGQLSHAGEDCPDRRGPAWVHAWTAATGWRKHTLR